MKGPVLVCFAVPQEAKPFSNAPEENVRVIVTGMGPRNAERVIREAFAQERPAAVFTCGFAGALAPGLKIGDVLFETSDAQLANALEASGAAQARFVCAHRVAVTAAEKANLRMQSNAEAVEMESGVIQRFCAAQAVPCATARAISDQANEDLPLDFNALLTPEDQLSPWRLALAVLGRPQKIPALMRLGKNSSIAARELSRVLKAALARWK